MAIEAGKYDPVPASVYSYTTTRTNGEPIQTAVVFLTGTFIRFPYMARSGYEQPAVKQQHSIGQIIIAVRNNEKTALIKPAMEFRHRGSVYGILAPQPIMERDELHFICQYKTASDPEVT